MDGMDILVTGFEPFGQDSSNASEQVLARLPQQVAGHRLSTAVLPVSFSRAGNELAKAVRLHQPDALICLGEAGGRDKITPELRGYNRDEARIADNDGYRPQGQQIVEGGAAAVRCSLEPEPMVQALVDAGFPAELSKDPGRFLCNHVAYLAYHRPLPALFIHVPAVRAAGVVATVGAETDHGAPLAHGWDLPALGKAIEVCLGTL